MISAAGNILKTPCVARIVYSDVHVNRRAKIYARQSHCQPLLTQCLHCVKWQELVETSIHPWIFFFLSGAKSWGQQPEQLPGKLARDNFPGMSGGTPKHSQVSQQVCCLSSVSWVFLEPSLGGTCLDHLTQGAPRRHPYLMPKPPQPAPFNVDEQRL